MKTIETKPVDQPHPDSSFPAQPVGPTQQSRFDSIFGRMKGTFTIAGDIVNPDHEAWNCERD